VIRFKCIYCGQRITANDGDAGKVGRCPTCRHELHVLKKITPPINTTLSESELEEKAKAKLDLMNAIMELPQKDAADLIKEEAGWFIPVYDELSLFLMTITLILLAVANASFKEQLYKWSPRFSNDVRVFIAAPILLAGMVLSIYNVFTTREKTDVEKWIMLLFAVLTNAGTGIISGWIVLTSSIRDWQIIFPIWNVINSILLVVMLRYRVVDEECISDRDASLKEVAIGLIAVLAIFIFCNNVFNLHWAITFSICIIYTTCLDKGLQSVFPGLTAQEAEAES
jgi:DNA-directed RNA polymerase subunit RPC12/RpoP